MGIFRWNSDNSFEEVEYVDNRINDLNGVRKRHREIVDEVNVCVFLFRTILCFTRFKDLLFYGSDRPQWMNCKTTCITQQTTGRRFLKIQKIIRKMNGGTIRFDSFMTGFLQGFLLLLQNATGRLWNSGQASSFFFVQWDAAHLSHNKFACQD